MNWHATPVERFLCLTCGSSFSKKAFSLTYWLKRPELLRPIAAGLQACSAHRQIARTLVTLDIGPGSGNSNFYGDGSVTGWCGGSAAYARVQGTWIEIW